MSKISLNELGKDLRRQVEDLLDSTRKMISGPSYDYNKIQEKLQELGQKAHELHMELKKNGNPPKHRKYMIENRGMAPDSKEFYNHIHPVEDLLAFIENSTANDEPEDKTMGETFDFRVYNRRWDHEDTYKLTRNRDGWYIKYIEPVPE